MNQIKEAVHLPEHLSVFINIGIDLYRRQLAGARFDDNALSEGEWACLLGAQEGTNRGRNEKQEAAHKAAMAAAARRNR